jgi:hypothetical protein
LGERAASSHSISRNLLNPNEAVLSELLASAKRWDEERGNGKSDGESGYQMGRSPPVVGVAPCRERESNRAKVCPAGKLLARPRPPQSSSRGWDGMRPTEATMGDARLCSQCPSGADGTRSTAIARGDVQTNLHIGTVSRSQSGINLFETGACAVAPSRTITRNGIRWSPGTPRRDYLKYQASGPGEVWLYRMRDGTVPASS